MMNWKNIDLNLLVSFRSLYELNSVSAAAEKNHVSQSAMSHSLSRLRVWFNDPLFERKGHQMQATERAHHLAPSVMLILEHIERDLLSSEVFEPKTYSGVCRIGLTDYAELIFAPIIYDAIRRSAPKVQISFINVNRHNYVSMFAEEKLDVVIGSIPQLQSQYSSLKLYTEEHVCLFDPKVLTLSDPFTVSDFCNIEQALISPDGDLSTHVDQQLADLGLKRTVTVASRSFLTIRRLLNERPLIAIVPKRMAEAEMMNDNLEMIVPPLPVADFDISLVWQTNQTTQDKQQWLSGVIQNCLSN
ncbi:LysR family transcriptional regulator [Vibrio sp. 10N.286.49.B3]|nr:LysR family transcriptional regulator [Vibrio sp. 10N.286.49.B3]